MLDRRHVNEEASRQRDMRCDSSTFSCDRFFRDLYKNFLAFAKELGDRRLWSTVTSIATSSLSVASAIIVSIIASTFVTIFTSIVVTTFCPRFPSVVSAIVVSVVPSIVVTSTACASRLFLFSRLGLRFDDFYLRFNGLGRCCVDFDYFLSIAIKLVRLAAFELACAFATFARTSTSASAASASTPTASHRHFGDLALLFHARFTVFQSISILLRFSASRFRFCRFRLCRLLCGCRLFFRRIVVAVILLLFRCLRKLSVRRFRRRLSFFL